MPIKILMPSLSPTMEEGAVAKWLKKEGDVVSPGDILLEVETDKATMEVEATQSGKLAFIVIAAGQENVKVGTVIGYMADDDETIEQIKADLANNQTADNHIINNKIDESSISLAAELSSTVDMKDHNSLLNSVEVNNSELNNIGDTTSKQRLLISPLAKKLAHQHKIALTEINISTQYSNKRITKSDILKYLEEKSSKTATSSIKTVNTTSSDNTLIRTDASVASRVQPLSKIQKITAQRLTSAKQEIPHFYLKAYLKIAKLQQLRKQINEQLSGTQLPTKVAKISLNDLLIKAVAYSLMQNPAVNVRMHEQGMEYCGDADISFAVATETGLFTPIIFQAQKHSILEIAQQSNHLIQLARQGKLPPQAYQGGTFGISNLGMYGISEFQAIINPPQSCMLAVGSSYMEAAGSAHEASEGVLTVWLSVDHRLIDGAIAAKFLQTLSNIVASPITLLLA